MLILNVLVFFKWPVVYFDLVGFSPGIVINKLNNLQKQTMAEYSNI